MSLATIDEALKRIRRGEMVLVVDDEDRENEGDLTMAACWVTPEAVNFMLRWARGLVCMPCDAGASRRARHAGRWSRRTAPAATRRSRCRSTTSPRAAASAPPTAPPRSGASSTPPRADRLPAPRPRVPAARARRRRARAPRPHRGRRRPRPPRRPPAGRGDLRGALATTARRRASRSSSSSRRSTASRWSRSTRSSSTACATTTPPRTVSSRRCSCSRVLTFVVTGHAGRLARPNVTTPRLHVRSPRRRRALVWAVGLAIARLVAAGCLPPPPAPPPPVAPTTIGVTHAVATRQSTFVDSTRSTPAFGDFGGTPWRSLPTTIWYPSDGGGPFPLVVFVPGFGVTPDYYAQLLEPDRRLGLRRGLADVPVAERPARRADRQVGWDDLAPDTWFVTTSVLDLSASGDPAIGGLIDPQRIAVAGHSDGAAVAFQDGYTPYLLDPRVRAVVVLRRRRRASTARTNPTGVRSCTSSATRTSTTRTTPRSAWDRGTLQQPKTDREPLERVARRSVHRPERSALRRRGARDDRVPRREPQGPSREPVLRRPLPRRPLLARRGRVAARPQSSVPSGGSSRGGQVHDGTRALGVIGVEHDVDVVELGLGRLGHDRRLLLLRPALERVAHAEQSGRDHRARGAAPEPVDRTFPAPRASTSGASPSASTLAGRLVGRRAGVGVFVHAVTLGPPGA